MKRILLCLLALLTVCVMLAACGHSGTEDEAPAAAEPTPAAAEPTPEPTPELPPYEPNMLTGAARDADYAVNQRPVAVMINNITQARPQYGLSKADIITEIEVEGGITRLMAIFQNYKTMGEVGPIRSGRIQYFELIAPWEMIYLHDGENKETVSPLVRALNYTQWNIGESIYGIDRKPEHLGISYRVNRTNWNGSSLDAVHREFFSGDRLDAFLQKDGVDTQRNYSTGSFFYFMDYRQPDNVRDLGNSMDSSYPPIVSEGVSYPIVADAPYIEIVHNENMDFRTRFFYDSAANVYNMEQWYSANYSGGNQWLRTMDAASNTQLNFTNVVILFTEIDNYPNTAEKGGLKRVDYLSGGVGYYFYGGKYERIFWAKGNTQDRLRLFYADENGQMSDVELPLNIGKTYLSVVDLDCFQWFADKTLNGGGAGETPAANSNVGSYTSLNGMAAPSDYVSEGDDDENDVADSADTENTGASGTQNTAAADTSADTAADTAAEAGDHEHIWDEGTVTVPASCTAAGQVLYTCTVCGETHTEETAPAAHTFADGVCTVCGAADPNYTPASAPEGGDAQPAGGEAVA